jgi:predicted glycogen debranching enzyme
VRIGWRRGDGEDALVDREWLVANGLGGYSTGTLAGVCTRRYHGLLVASLPGVGRTVMLSQLHDAVRREDGGHLELGGAERAGGLELDGAAYLEEFRLEMGLPVWTYQVRGARVEKRIVMPHRQNTVRITYRLLDGPAVTLRLRPGVHFRPHDAPVGAALQRYRFSAEDGRYELVAPDTGLPPLRTFLGGARAAFVLERERLSEVVYRVERSRGYDAQGDLWSPGYFQVELASGHPVLFVASTEPWDVGSALAPEVAIAAEEQRRRRLLRRAPPAAREGPAAELVLAADAFVITPMGRVEDQVRSRAEGDEPRTVIAGYHWFTDWGRDTMISLEGLTLATGRHEEAGFILRTFARHVKDGLIPNLFPEGQSAGLYHTADATLWMFHAMDRYVRATGDRSTLRHLLPTFESIARAHVAGTRFGIRVDPRDGLLTQGEEGYQLTWMDAKCDGWVVTPRRGKAVELNALWYHATTILAGWIAEERGGAAAAPWRDAAARARAAFNARFWFAEGRYLYDVVDGEGGDDASFRPNQIFAVSLPNPVLERERWAPVVDAVRARLLTPVGLRSLSRDHPDYKPNYHGDLRTRDAAYHQGTVWSWLVGPLVDAWLATHPGDRAGARELLGGLVAHLGDACIGSVSEVFDAEPPFTARGCIAQAWGVAELLRALLRTGDAP